MLRLPPFDKIGVTPVPNFVNADPTNSVQGSIVNGEVFNQVQREGENLELLAGLTPNGNDLTQWSQAASRGGVWVGSLTGTGDLAVATLGTVMPTLLQGMRVGAVAAASNTTTAPKLRVTNLGSTSLFIDFPIILADGSAPAVGAIKPGRLYRFEADGAGNVIISGGGITSSGGASSGTVPILMPSPTLYVRTDGNDSGDGSSNDPQHAFRTIAAAATYGTSKLYFAGTTLTIKLGITGTYDAPGILPGGAVSMAIVGDANNPGGYVVQGAGNYHSNGVIASYNGMDLTLTGIQIQNTGNTNNTVCSFAASLVTYSCIIASSGQGTQYAHAFSSAAGSLGFGTGTVFTGNMTACIWASAGGTITLADNSTFSVTGNPTFSVAFAIANVNGSIGSAGANSWNGAANCARYNANTNGVISSGGGGEYYFPGSFPGVTGAGGQYV